MLQSQLRSKGTAPIMLVALCALELLFTIGEIEDTSR